MFRHMANSGRAVFTTPHVARKHGLNRLDDGPPGFAQAPGRPCDRHAEESCRGPRGEDGEPATKQHPGRWRRRQLQHHVE